MSQRGALGPKEVPMLGGALLLLLAPLPHYRSGIPADNTLYELITYERLGFLRAQESCIELCKQFAQSSITFF